MPESEDPPGCPECERLFQQERAAMLAGDMSRRTDVRVLRRRHASAQHPQREQEQEQDEREQPRGCWLRSEPQVVPGSELLEPWLLRIR